MPTTKDGKTVTSIGYQNYEELYLDWVNNFMTTRGFASHHNISEPTATRLIDDAIWLYRSKYDH